MLLARRGLIRALDAFYWRIRSKSDTLNRKLNYLLMSTTDVHKPNQSLPSWPVRWFILFRLFPGLLFDARFLSGVIIKRESVFWDNVMRIEMRRRSGNDEDYSSACSKQEQRVLPPRGDWHGDS